MGRLGDGTFWYALMLTLLSSDGTVALSAVLRMIAARLVCTAIYKLLKAKTSCRLYQVHPEILCGAASLGGFGFHSGYTLHVVALSTVEIRHNLQRYWLLLPVILLVALSRIVLGLRNPSDVLAGMILGAVVAGLMLAV
jgi:undecaprenyl-diphosphatase